MNCAEMILDSVSVANLDEVNLSDMVASGVNFPEFTWLKYIKIDIENRIQKDQNKNVKYIRKYIIF